MAFLGLWLKGTEVKLSQSAITAFLSVIFI